MDKTPDGWSTMVSSADENINNLLIAALQEGITVRQVSNLCLAVGDSTFRMLETPNPLNAFMLMNRAHPVVRPVPLEPVQLMEQQDEEEQEQ